MRHSFICRAALIVILLAFAEPAVTQTPQGPVSDKPLHEKWAPGAVQMGTERPGRLGQPHE
jgi:hypothetical protein